MPMFRAAQSADAMPPDVPARQEADIGPAEEGKDGVQRGKGTDRESLAFLRPFTRTGAPAG